MKKRDNTGFTLIEITIVLLIISILSVFAVPSYQKYLEKQKDRDAIIALQTITGAFKMYVAKHGQNPPDRAGADKINGTLQLNLNENDWYFKVNKGCSIPNGKISASRTTEDYGKRMWVVDPFCTGKLNDIRCFGSNCP